jgi:hypothetical protein
MRQAPKNQNQEMPSTERKIARVCRVNWKIRQVGVMGFHSTWSEGACAGSLGTAWLNA